MKKKISISMDKTTFDRVQDKVEDGLFRNTSHLIEYAVRSFLKNGNR